MTDFGTDVMLKKTPLGYVKIRGQMFCRGNYLTIKAHGDEMDSSQ